MRENQIDSGFYTPQSYCTFVKDSNTADAIICLLSIKTTQSEAAKIFQLTETEEPSRNGARSLIFVDNMQTVNWDHPAYKELVANVEGALKDVKKDRVDPIFVPISSKDGDNFLDLSKKSAWYSSGEYKPLTVVQAIDS